MPQPNDQHKKDADERETLFFGEPEKILIEVKPPENADPAAGGQPPADADPAANPEDQKQATEEKKENLDDTVEVKPQIVPKNFTELDRLAFVVAAIENDTHVVPEGAFKYIPSHEIRRNESYKGTLFAILLIGLEKKDLPRLDKYYHFRNVQLQEKKIMLETSESVFRSDIFDPILSDHPKGAWSVQADSAGVVGTVRSLLWPGYVAFSIVGTDCFGGVYMGDGIKNKDLPFML